jgi:hypothetical protein
MWLNEVWYEAKRVPAAALLQPTADLEEEGVWAPNAVFSKATNVSDPEADLAGGVWRFGNPTGHHTGPAALAQDAISGLQACRVVGIQYNLMLNMPPIIDWTSQQLDRPQLFQQAVADLAEMLQVPGAGRSLQGTCIDELTASAENANLLRLP